jgi:FKBP-type peptidyl-prolyl cis-trans isomerase FklB
MNIIKFGLTPQKLYHIVINNLFQQKSSTHLKGFLMKFPVALLLCMGILACQSNTQDRIELKSQKDSLSYSIGMNIGQNLKMQGYTVNPAVITKGMKDILDSIPTLITEDRAQAILMSSQQQMMAKQQEVTKMQAEKNKKEGEAFLAENKKKEGVVTLPSGLQYKIITKGSGRKPAATDTVTVNYRGTLIDGKEFDSSIKRGQPATFAVNAVIKGWTESLQQMTIGSKWILYIPPELAYSERGAGNVIPPNATLIFEVELLSIK